MNMSDIESRLKDSGLRASPIRILIGRFLERSGAPVSALDIEIALETVDRSSISRTLNSFAAAGLVHLIEDGSGSTKYEYCRHSDDLLEHSDLHPHFHCTGCGRTICLSEETVPAVTLPEGYQVSSVNYVIKGLCDACSVKAK